jgi:hypothetical protein
MASAGAREADVAPIRVCRFVWMMTTGRGIGWQGDP